MVSRARISLAVILIITMVLLEPLIALASVGSFTLTKKNNSADQVRITVAKGYYDDHKKKRVYTQTFDVTFIFSGAESTETIIDVIYTELVQQLDASEVEKSGGNSILIKPRDGYDRERVYKVDGGSTNGNIIVSLDGTVETQTVKPGEKFKFAFAPPSVGNPPGVLLATVNGYTVTAAASIGDTPAQAAAALYQAMQLASFDVTLDDPQTIVINADPGGNQPASIIFSHDGAGLHKQIIFPDLVIVTGYNIFWLISTIGFLIESIPFLVETSMAHLYYRLH